MPPAPPRLSVHSASWPLGLATGTFLSIVHKNESSYDIGLELNLRLYDSKGLRPSFSQKIFLQGKKKTKCPNLKHFLVSIIPRLSVPLETQFSIVNGAEV